MVAIPLHLLPPAPARIRVPETAEAPAATLADLPARLREMGYTVTGLGPLAPSDAPGDGALLAVADDTNAGSTTSASPEDLLPLLKTLKATLTPEARIVLFGQSAASRRAAEVALAEGGFVIRRREVPDSGMTDSGVPDSGAWACTARLDAFRSRLFRDGDEVAILDFFEQCFHHRRESDHWSWQYRQNPEGGPRVSLTLETGEGNGHGRSRVVAHYAGYPVRFFRAAGTDHAEELVAQQIGDTMTRPDVRHVGRGPTSLLARTGRHFYARCCEGHVAFNYGFNVGNIQKFSMRFLDAHRVEDVPFWRRRLLPELGERHLRPGLWTKLRYRGQCVERPGEDWDTLWREASTAYALLARRDRTAMTWRYFDRPGFSYFAAEARRGRRLVAWGVFRRDGDRLLWGDALFHPRHRAAAGPLLEAALAHPQAVGAERVEGWFAPRPAWVGDILQGLGFERHPEPQKLALMCVPFAAPSAPDVSIPDMLARELYYTFGDSDLF